MKKEINPIELDFLLRYPSTPNSASPVDFISNVSWGAIKTLSGMDEFRFGKSDWNHKKPDLMSNFTLLEIWIEISKTTPNVGGSLLRLRHPKRKSSPRFWKIASVFLKF
jgi:hypothetical protein